MGSVSKVHAQDMYALGRSNPSPNVLPDDTREDVFCFHSLPDCLMRWFLGVSGLSLPSPCGTQEDMD